ncbi:MAG: hypothetical protein JW704_02230 [Anaerolineaceae bacterium]|nr:hypothetical protein [Anaerolineaceae bacterium]MBN2676844.1 hypothetical protein [Anaerolineaceae bacterium]
MTAVLDWLLEGPAWVAYRARLDLMGISEQAPEGLAVRSAMLADPAVRQLVCDLDEWPGPAIKSHKATMLYHKLGFLADIGCRHDDPGIHKVIEVILGNQSPEGPFTVPINIPIAFGGDGEIHQTWMLTDAPMLLSALIRLGLGADARVVKATGYLAGLVRDNGWPCAAAPELGRFRGPGRKDDPCPFANLGMLRVLADLPEWRDSSQARRGIDMILTQWENRQQSHPYLFKMGTDFCKLKVPFIWYDLLHVLDTLSRFPGARADVRYQEMVAVLDLKASADGFYTAESIYQVWKNWEFGQKKVPSYWITFLALRILARG